MIKVLQRICNSAIYANVLYFANVHYRCVVFHFSRECRAYVLLLTTAIAQTEIQSFGRAIGKRKYQYIQTITRVTYDWAKMLNPQSC